MSLELELEKRVHQKTLQLVPRVESARQLAEVLSAPRHTLEDVVRVIRSCPVLTAATLRLANAPALQHPPTLHLLEAVSRLAPAELRRLAMGASLSAGTRYAGALVAARTAAWHDAVLSGLLCASLARRFEFDPEALFVVGLLHDLGTVVALGTLEYLLAQQEPPPPRDVSEWLALARAHHVEVGVALAASWGLPTPLPEVIAQHEVANEETLDWASLVRTANRLLAHLKAGLPLGEARAPVLDRLRPDQRERFLRSLERLPAAVDAMETESRPFDSGIYRGAGSYVTALPAPGPTDASLCEVRLRQGYLARLTSVSAERLLLLGPVALHENYLEELELLGPGEPRRLWVRVVRSSLPNARGEHVVEAVPFAPSRELIEYLGSLAAPARLEACA